jgi:chemotaxis protein MotB
MRRIVVAAVVPLMALLVASSNSGCVSAAKYRDLETSARNMQAALEKAETELQGERAKAKELQAKLAAAESELQAKNSQIQTLMDARDRLKAAYEALRAEFDKIKGQGMTPVTITKVVQLPPALDKLLKEFASKHPEILDYDSARGLLKWKSDLLFDLGSADLKPAALPALQEFAGILKSDAANGFDIMIAGHTDNTRIAKPQTRQQHPTNWHLSAHRAISVLFELTKDGVEPTRTTVMGYGEYQPIAPNDTTEHKQQNRRVEIYLVRKGTVQSVSMGVFEVPGLGLSYLAAATETRLGS